jgi:hypothetical protein
MWTLPYVFPESGIKDSELSTTVDSTGARAVNHLSNKLTMTLFPPHQPFFRLVVQDDVMEEFRALAKEGDADSQDILDELDKRLASIEKSAMRALDYTRYRTEATMAAKGLIITGNSLLYHPEGKGTAQTYSVRDYCVARDMSGNIVRIITRDIKSLFTFAPSVQDLLRNTRAKSGENKGKLYKDDSDVTLYTLLELHSDGRFHLTQYADSIKLETNGAWPKDDLPWIVLTWNLIRGEDYGRGLVEDFAGSFHAMYCLNRSLVDAVGVAADIKFLVNPTSQVDIVQINKSASGSYHTGVEGDITTVKLDKMMDLQLVEAAIERFSRQIAQAFLLNSAVARDAERVTAEEIRYVAQELELSHGGVYSRFAADWQAPTARLSLKSVNTKIGKNDNIYPQIITGLDSLSKAGDLDNLRMWVSDLQMLQAIPEEFRAVINQTKYLQFVGVRRGVDYDSFLKTPAEMAQEQQAAQQAQASMMEQEAATGFAAEAGKQMMKE